jgi:hypothetical protein
MVSMSSQVHLCNARGTNEFTPAHLGYELINNRFPSTIRNQRDRRLQYPSSELQLWITRQMAHIKE